MNQPVPVCRKAVVAEKYCCRCGRCVSVCPVGAICMEDGLPAHTDPDKCIGCGRCSHECPCGLIRMWEVTPEGPGPAEKAGLW